MKLYIASSLFKIKPIKKMPQGKILPVKPALTDVSASLDEESLAKDSKAVATNDSTEKPTALPDREPDDETKE